MAETLTLQDRMLTYRAKHRMTQRDFAEKAGISLQTVCSVENARQTPTKITLEKIRLVLEETE